MLDIILWGVVILLLVRQAKQDSRITTLEEKHSKRTEVTAATATPTTQVASAEPRSIPLAQDALPIPISPNQPTDSFAPQTIAAESTPQPQTESEPFFLVEWFKEQTLIKVGALIFFLGAVWFLSYAFEQNWISPLMRIMLGLAAGVVAWGIGHMRRTNDVTQYQVLTVLGSGIWFGTVVASQFAFATILLPPTIALVLLIAAIVYTVLVALQTKTEWLATVAAIAGMAAPWFVNPPEADAFGLLVYLFVLSAGLLVVVFMTQWRLVSLALLLGVTLQHTLLFSTDAISHPVLWLFVVVFTVLFFTTSSVTLLRTLTLKPIDITLFGILGVQFWYFVATIGLFPAIAMFIAAAATAAVGYLARQRGAGVDVVSLFAAFSAAGIFIGTSYLFDGFTLTIAYALEALVVTVLAVKVATAPRSVMVASATFALPIFNGLLDLSNPAWQNGIVHPQGFSVLVVALSVGIAAWYLTRKAVLNDPLLWLQSLAGVFAVVWYVFSLVVTFVVSESLATQNASTESLFTLFSLVLMVVTVVAVVSSVSWPRWRTVALWPGVPAAIAGVAVLIGTSLSTWSLFVSGLVIVVFVTLAALFAYGSRRTTVASDAVSGYALLWCSLAYSAIWLWKLWDQLLPRDLASVLTYVSYAAVLYVVINILLQIKTKAAWIVPIIGAFVLPGVLSVNSISFDGWSNVLATDAVGIYFLTTIVLLLATTLRQYRGLSQDGLDYRQISDWLFGVGGVMVVATIWMVTHTVASSDALAITTALLIYTVSGLAAYLYGRSHAQSAWRRAGIVLLVGVVARLGLFDVWGMDPLWRVITFLGIGALFIAAALLEKPLASKDASTSKIES